VIEPTYIELSKKFKNITFYKLSVDIQELKDVYKTIPVTSIPSFTFHKDGEEKFFLEGKLD
jgi:thiol-disulfide isomerase/thioredoxin